MEIGTRPRVIAASLFAAIILALTALPGGLLVTGGNPVLLLSLFTILWTPLINMLRLWPVLLVTAGAALASVPASCVSFWWLGGGVDDLGALLRGPAVYISTAVSLAAFTAAVTYFRHARRREPRAI